MALGNGPFAPERQCNFKPGMITEPLIIIQLGIQVIFRRELLVEDQFRLIEMSLPEFEYIKKDQDDNIERQRINGQLIESE